MAKLALLAVLASLFGAVSCDLSISIYARWGWPLPTPGQPRSPLPPASPPSSPTPALEVGYYKDKCPSVDVEKIVYDEVKKATPGVQAGLVRLFFHDCFVRGCDASVLLNGNDTEKQGFPNLSLRGFEVIENAKAVLETKCEGVVSCADIVAFAGRDASSILSYGAINYKVPAGRFDGTVSLASDTLGKNLPPPFADLDQLTRMFADKGLSQLEMVALSGAHSIGVSHCGSFSNRLPPNNTTRAMEDELATNLTKACNTSDPVTVPQDYKTPDSFDIQYYKNVLSNDALFESDMALLGSQQTSNLVDCYANNRNCSPLQKLFGDGAAAWYRHFEKAMVNMGNIEVKNKTQGEIRNKCGFVNDKPY
ncbi:unnamed protein product [Alopecurus aequalis]